jgi:predicted metalloprotease with PDZ domain
MPMLAMARFYGENRRMAKPSDPRTVTYRVAFPEPHTHLFDVVTRVPLPEGRDAVDLALPAWTPGSYRVRDFSRHIQDFEASAPITKIDKQTWRFHVAGKRDLELRYKVYANELTVRTAHLDDRHAYFNGANLFLYVAGETARPARLEIATIPAGWTVATGLDPAADGTANAFEARSYDELIDAPVDVAAFARADFDVDGVPHRIFMDGEGNYELTKLRDDIEKIVRSELAMWGGAPPYPHYTFITHCVPDGVPGGGLEHGNSTTLMFQRFKFRPRDKYEDFLALVSHEFFHLWNVKRLRPRELGPFEYRGETYTRALWIVEGVTSYYDELFLRRAGIWDADAYLRKTAEHVNNVQETPGRGHQSLEDSSFDAWIKYYQRNEHSHNATISYYEKGQLVAWLLDLEIRSRSRGERSLDDVMRELYREHPETGPGYDPARFEALASRAAGSDLSGFFADYVRGVKELDYDRHLAPFGLRLVLEPRSKAESKSPEPELRARLGAKTRGGEGGRVHVYEVLEGTPAWRAGVQPGDELLAIDGFKASADAVEARLHERKPGDKVALALFRGDRLVQHEATLDAAPWAKAAIVRRPEASEAERKLYEGWLGEVWKTPATA